MMNRNQHFQMLPDLDLHREKVEAEFDTYYATFDPHTQPLLDKMQRLVSDSEEVSSYELKTRMYELLCRECPVHLFRESDFFFEISSGRGRPTWGGLQSPVGSYLHSGDRGWWLREYEAAVDADRKEGFFHGWSPVGMDHHCPGYDRILQLGLNGIIRQAEEKLEDCKDLRKEEFYRCVIRANRALIGLAGRFAAEAKRLADIAASAEETAHYQKISSAAERVPANPPETFYEALCTVLFYRECVGSLEGIGFSTFGQLDRMLYPYYQADLENGRITVRDALQLFCDLLLYTEVRFDAKHAYHETSTTIELGGCDRAGNVVYNDLTELILDAVVNIRSINTKINCRISRKHPRVYLEKIARVQLENLPALMMHNDDVLIPARINCGQDAEDARMYVGGGCHEIVLQGTEVCTRADSWISLPRILLNTMEHAQDYESYEAFYKQFMADVKAYHEKIVTLKNSGEAHWCEYDPLILYSSSITGSLDKGLDVTEGGAKYNSTALSMLGAANLVDSLYSIRQLVFVEKKLTLGEYYRIVRENFVDNEVLRQYIIKKLPKHGTNDKVLNAFSAQILSDLAEVSDQTNARGGKYLPAFYPHDICRQLGLITGATPDGRAANTPLSRGVSPSEFILTDSPLDVIHSLKCIDFTQYADSFIAEITLPRMEDHENGIQVLTSIIDAFLDAEGSSLQFNLIDRDMLLEAQKNPENHQSLMVRVCGYSAAFVFLNVDTQQEIMNRAIR